ncbi:hypothetical protein EEL32_10870 [Brevibacillus laterosporus]|uniref:Uncharacterized protein n=1 Tax=Brevibacillus laterosporus TaxID=1465 RepID=A0A502HC65_BRELA|nr:hypothetical protein EEL30_23165 [Brevibacillus laterosporus]TPG70790.1 hypothetical protein EEL31_21640 [Brevibacillus laterosporus]TPG87915.1 hypothetical protein EEL32_10870 [Brevibacillus laterosporus]
MKRNSYLLFGFLCGFISSIMNIYLWYAAIIRDQTIKGLFLVFLFFILFPAIFGLVTSFVSPPVIIISFVWSLPLSIYYMFSSTGIWFALFCFLYLVSAILKFKGINKLTLSQ